MKRKPVKVVLTISGTPVAEPIYRIEQIENAASVSVPGLSHFYRVGDSISHQRVDLLCTVPHYNVIIKLTESLI